MTLADRSIPLDDLSVDPDAERARLLAFYDDAVVDPAGGFHWLGFDGEPLDRGGKDLWLAARLTYCYALAELAGHRGAFAKVEHGLDFLEGPLRDRRYGGWFASTRSGARKEAYGHAHVVLAASAAMHAGHARARSLLESALDAVGRFREPAQGLFIDTFTKDWSVPEAYRGANANMHMTEALLAAGGVLDDPTITRQAVAVLDRILGGFAAESGWRVPEHFHPDWRPDPQYNLDNPRNAFRPYGSTVGHWYEWGRLSLHAWAATGRGEDRHVERAQHLYRAAERVGRGPAGSLVFTVDPDGAPSDLDRYHWPVTEAIGAAESLFHVVGDARLRDDVGDFWSIARRDFMDLRHGSWIHQLDESGAVSTTVWEGKPDLYHTLQATLVGRLPLSSDLAAAAAGH